MNAQSKISELLPDSLNEWEPVDKDNFYTCENLFEYINGGAELYISYGFNLVLSRTYRADNQPDIIVDIFEVNNSI